MVYKRYIKKNGKIYGPYVYHSHKENGKVISDYLGKDRGSVKPKNKRRETSPKKYFFFALVGMIAFLSLIFIINLDLTGDVSLAIESKYVEGESLKGSLKFNLKST